MPFPDTVDLGTATIPLAATIDDADGLPLGVTTRAEDGRTVIQLDAGGGEVTLTLRGDAGEPVATCTITAPSREKGRAFVRAMAAYLNQPEPLAPRELQPLTPTDCTYADLGQGQSASGAKWRILKLFLQPTEEGDEAEIVLRLAPNGERAQFVEKDPAFRKAIVDSLLRSLWAGTKPEPRLVVDSELATPDPLVAPTPIPGGGKASAVMWGEDSVTVAIRRGSSSKLLRWTGKKVTPAEVGTLSGMIRDMVASPTGALAALVAQPRVEHSISTEDPTDVVIVRDGQLLTLIRHDDARDAVDMLSNVAWSPNGAMVAVFAHDRTSMQPHVVVFDAASGRESDRTEGMLDEWNARGIEVSMFDVRSGSSSKRLWTPKGAAGGTIRMRPADRPVAIAGDELRVSTPKGTKRFKPKRREARLALSQQQDWTGLNQWLDGRWLVLPGESTAREPRDLYAIDIETLKLRRVTAQRLRFHGALPGGVALFADKDENLLVGSLGQP